MLFVCPISSLNRQLLLLVWRSMRWNFGGGVPLSGVKGNHNGLIFGYNISKLVNHDKDNSNNNVKSIVNIHVGNELDMLFCCCRKINSCIFWKVNSKFSWELFIFLFLCVLLCMGVHWKEKLIYIVIWLFGRFVCPPYLVCW